TVVCHQDLLSAGGKSVSPLNNRMQEQASGDAPPRPSENPLFLTSFRRSDIKYLGFPSGFLKTGFRTLATE
ncbi:MAG: hypothetical protein J6U01_03935, partial [Clostridia bacterium]|nr:hypothetical protein [Clostridia bacterium]